MTAREKFEKNKIRIKELKKIRYPILLEETTIDKEQDKLRVDILKEEKILSKFEWQYSCVCHGEVIKCLSDVGDSLDFINSWYHASIELMNKVFLIFDDNDIYISFDSSKKIPKIIKAFGIDIDLQRIENKIKKTESELKRLKNIYENTKG